MEKLTGAEILINALIEQGVDSIFGYPGASVLSVYDALSKSSIRHILTAHEQGACFAADGYARASGKCGVALTTSGPGATNLVTGIADAFMDSVPLVAITGNVTLQNLGHDSFQEVDIFDVTMPITKYSMIVKSAAEITPAIRKAFNIALSGRRGPVLVDIPSNVFDEKAVYVKKPAEKICGYASLNSTEIDNAIALINKSKRPLIYAGGGVKASKATAELFDFALKICAPVMVSYMGIGCFNPDDPSYVGVLSNINTKAHQALRECDLLITLGARFNSRYTAFDTVKKRKIPLLQIDVDKAEIDKNLLTTASVNAD
ncbi:MAG: thiamine pyrophosphate-binding protein, partial [Clostridia bacterium]